MLDRLRDALRTKHYAYRTEQAYVGWVRRFILFHGKRHLQEMGGREIEQFLTYLAVDGRVAASTQTQALCALLFLYKQVLGVKLPPLVAVRANRPKRLPVVLSQDEVRRLLPAVEGAHGAHRAMAGLMDGGGLRLMECCRLRVALALPVPPAAPDPATAWLLLIGGVLLQGPQGPERRRWESNPRCRICNPMP